MDRLLTDEEQFNLGFKTTYTATSPELFAYSEGVIDGAKAQIQKDNEWIKSHRYITELGDQYYLIPSEEVKK